MSLLFIYHLLALEGLFFRPHSDVLVVYHNFTFITEEEKKLVQEVFTNAIDILSEDDKKLPQVINKLTV